ncbi:hypothetical protein MMPV_007764 [Pyropia vietnamensis]
MAIPSPARRLATARLAAAAAQATRRLVATTALAAVAVLSRLADPLTVVLLVAAAAAGAAVTHFSAVRARRRRLANERPLGAGAYGGFGVGSIYGGSVDEAVDGAGENAMWLNASLRSAWRLLRKSTAALISTVLQPVVDGSELPPLVSGVSIEGLTLGSRPPLVRAIRRLPSRALSEVQFQFDCRLIGDLIMDLSVAFTLPGGGVIRVPVRVRDLDISARVWVGFNLIPLTPYVRFVHWALLERPTVGMELSLGKRLPLTAVPVLSSLIRRILTRDVPKAFLLPKTSVIDLMADVDPLGGPRPGAAGTGVKVKQGLEEVFSSTDDEARVAAAAGDPEALKDMFPALYGLFDSLDLNNDGSLSVTELHIGLRDWGLSTTDVGELAARLDVSGDGRVSWAEFAAVWPKIRSALVPAKYDGVIAGVVYLCDGVPVPTVGQSDAYVRLSVGPQAVTTKRDSETDTRGRGRGRAVWNESFEVLVESPSTAVLVVEVCEAAAFALGIVPLPPLSLAEVAAAAAVDGSSLRPDKGSGGAEADDGTQGTAPSATGSADGGGGGGWRPPAPLSDVVTEAQKQRYMERYADRDDTFLLQRLLRWPRRMRAPDPQLGWSAVDPPPPPPRDSDEASDGAGRPTTWTTPTASPQPVARPGHKVPPRPAPVRVLARGFVPVASLYGKGVQRVWLDLVQGGGRVRLALSYAAFVDAGLGPKVTG